MESLLRRYPGLAGFPRADLGVRPTPVEEHRIAGRTVLVKRDDLASEIYGGNKVRALEFCLARPAKRLLTFSTLGAHHAYATACHGARLGLQTEAIIVRKGTRGSLLPALGELALRCVEVNGPAGALLALARLYRPGTLVIPPGGMSARGALGYLAAAFEIESVPERVYVPLGTGTTVSGLLAGFMLRGSRTEVVAVRVADAVAGLPWLIWRRARRAVALLRAADPSIPRVNRGAVTLRVVKAEGAYGAPAPSSRAAVAAALPLDLEPEYTGKTLAVLLNEEAETPLFVHTYAGSGAVSGH
jgi:D-cysteine desulfhydrase